MSSRGSSAIQHAVRDAFDSRERVLLAVSGGVDSMVLLHAASVALPCRQIVVATFDHDTGLAASRAREHVVGWCEHAGIACVSDRAIGVPPTEEGLRNARWRFLRDVARSRGTVIATAHTEDDQIETVLMRILRGAGARGMAGLFAASDVRRPLLGFRRRHVAEYAAEHDVAWIEDPSNESPRYFRNRVRHDLLPALQRARPRLADDLLELSRLAAEWRAGVERLVAREIGVERRSGGLDVPIRPMRDLGESGLRVLWPAIAALAGATLDRRAIARLAEFTRRGKVGARAPVAGGWEVVRARDALELRASGLEVPRESVITRSAGIEWGEWRIRPSSSVGQDSWSAWLPSDGALTIRPWRAGDVLRTPGAMVGQRKVKELLSKAGVTGHERRSWPVVLSGDEIIWVPGVGRSDAATVRSGRSVLAFACEHNR